LSKCILELESYMYQKKFKSKPLLRGLIHQAMFFIAVGACAPLIIKSSSAEGYVATSIYSAAILMMFGFSALYHRFNWYDSAEKWMRKLDHVGIFIMIAGTITPLCLLILPSNEGIILLIVIWSIAILGILQSFLFSPLPRVIRVFIYVLMGFAAIPYMASIFQTISITNSVLIVTGSVLYVIGALGYSLKFPKLSPKVFSYHEVFHVLVSVAATLHFIVIYSII